MVAVRFKNEDLFVIIGIIFESPRKSKEFTRGRFAAVRYPVVLTQLPQNLPFI